MAAAEISAAPDTVESGRGAAPGGDALDGEKHEADAKPDIEHVFVKDDPRAWSRARKNVTLVLISFASMISGLGGSIQNPAIEDMQLRLNATSGQISLSIALFILIQGIAPLFWSAVTEIKGRKPVYLVSITIFFVASIVTATARTIELVIGFRFAQAVGSSAILAIGAGTLADIFEPSERGTKMGIYYMSLTLATGLGPIFGGVLTQLFHWNGVFWFLAIFSGISVVAFAFGFKDTFRRERSTTYQNVLRHHEKQSEKRRAALLMSEASSQTVVEGGAQAEKWKKGRKPEGVTDVERAEDDDTRSDVLTLEEVKLKMKDVNPLKPMWKVMKRRNNVACLIGSGLLFSFVFVVVYTSARTLAMAYHYNALKIGFVLLAFGVGSMVGSLSGGWYSDYVLAKLKTKNGGESKPEMRLYSTIPGMILLPPAILGFGWASNETAHIAVICVMLFLCGLGAIWIYSSTLAYIVDSNVGRSSTAVASNSSFRGTAAFVAMEVAVPLQDSLGDGWMYTLWAGLVVIAQLMLLLVMWKGTEWREEAEREETDVLSASLRQVHEQEQRKTDAKEDRSA